MIVLMAKKHIKEVVIDIGDGDGDGDDANGKKTHQRASLKEVVIDIGREFVGAPQLLRSLVLPKHMIFSH